jgi:hypothetical protein
MLTLRDTVVAAETDYGTALLDQDTGQYWALNPTGTIILRVLLAGGDRDRAAITLLDRYDVDVATAQSDIDLLLTQLHGAGLVAEEHGTGGRDPDDENQLRRDSAGHPADPTAGPGTDAASRVGTAAADTAEPEPEADADTDTDAAGPGGGGRVL